MPLGRALAFLVLCTGINLGLNQAWTALSPGWEIHLFLLLDLSLMGMAVGAGCLLSRGVAVPGHIIPLVLAAGMADLWSVSIGVTRDIIQSPAAMNHLMIHFPVPGQGIRPLVGVMDFTFAALFFSLSGRFSLPCPRSFLALSAAFAGTIILAVLSGWGLPLLPAMGLGFVLVHFTRVRMTDPKEKKQAAAVLVLIALALLVFSLMRR